MPVRDERELSNNSIDKSSVLAAEKIENTSVYLVSTVDQFITVKTFQDDTSVTRCTAKHVVALTPPPPPTKNNKNTVETRQLNPNISNFPLSQWR